MLLQNRDFEQNPELVESAVLAAFVTLHPINASALILLAEAPWHQRHEDAVRALQMLRSPNAGGELERAAFSGSRILGLRHNYALARKCIWALADLGTDEAYEALTRIGSSNDPAIAGYAKSSWMVGKGSLPFKGYCSKNPGLHAPDFQKGEGTSHACEIARYGQGLGLSLHWR
jgi:hypothetical protein